MVKRFIPVLCLALGLVISGASLAADVVFKDKAGRVLTLDDLAAVSGTFSWEPKGANAVPQAAISLHEQGRAAGEKGDYAAAIAAFEKAAVVAPGWPYPPYDMGYTYLLQRNFAQAQKYYEKALALSPRGYFTVITATNSLAREKTGEFPVGTYLKYLSLEWTQDPAKKRKIIDEILAKSPRYAPAWKAAAGLAGQEEDREKALECIEKGLASNPDAETKGFLLMNQALILWKKGRQPEALEILGTLALDPKSPYDVEVLSKKTLAYFLKPQ